MYPNFRSNNFVIGHFPYEKNALRIQIKNTCSIMGFMSVIVFAIMWIMSTSFWRLQILHNPYIKDTDPNPTLWVRDSAHQKFSLKKKWFSNIKSRLSHSSKLNIYKTYVLNAISKFMTNINFFRKYSNNFYLLHFNHTRARFIWLVPFQIIKNGYNRKKW